MRRVRELRIFGEAIAIILITWLLLRWFLIDRAITQADGSVLVAPFIRSSLSGSADWTDHLYRVGVIGGSKMHEFAGTMPIVQLANVLGLSTTITVNLITIFIQLCFAFFGVVGLGAMVECWAPGRALSFAERAIAVWSFAFMPLLAWRYAYGHENLLFGLLPLWIGVALLFAARARHLGIISLSFAAFAVANGVSGLGAQTLAYSAVFGTPLVILSILDAPAGRRWSRLHWVALAAIACGILAMLPRIAPMVAHALGEDASRGLGDSVKEAFGITAWRDWLGSLPWTYRVVQSWQPESLHEHDFAIGPLMLFLPFAWRPGRRVVVGLLAGIALALLFAQNVPLISGLLAFLDAFRVPARAMLPVAMFVPLIALAACFARTRAPEDHRLDLLVVLIAGVAIVALQHLPAYAVEVLAWCGCIGVVVVMVRKSAWLSRTTPALLAVAALGVVSFAARFPRTTPWDTVEHGPNALYAAAIQQAPELADPLNRVVVREPTLPFAMSTAFAADLGSLDGVWYPPKRFLALLSALSGRPVPATACVFDLFEHAGFPILQQLYNVRYLIDMSDHVLRALPAPAGAAWFPREIAVIDEPRGMAIALAKAGDVRPPLRTTAWVLSRESAPRSISPACANAKVLGARSDGQAITVDLETPAECVVVVATNYVSVFRATATVGGVAVPTSVFPVDIALTGIRAPVGATRIVLRPVVAIPWWSRAAQVLGLCLFVAALASLRRL